MANIKPYTDAFKDARYGETVRDAMVGLAEELNSVVTNASDIVTNYDDRLETIESDINSISSNGKNVYDSNSMISGYLNSNGSIHADNGSGWITSPFILVMGQYVCFSMAKNSDNTRRYGPMYFFTQYDTNKAVISQIATPTGQYITLESNTVYIRYCLNATITNNYHDFQVEFNNKRTSYELPGRYVGEENLTADLKDKINDTANIKKWIGKKWVCLGDSLTERNSRTTISYHDYVSESTGISIVNMGVSGTGYMRHKEDNIAFYQRAVNIPTDADVITIFGSGNDLTLINNLGTPSDTTTDTICGCINETIDVIIELIPTACLGIVSPTPWVGNQPTADDSNSMARYADALRTICKIRSIPFLDLYHCSNLRPWTNEGRAACYTKDDGNGVHPDEIGHKIIAPRFKSFLETLIL